MRMLKYKVFSYPYLSDFTSDYMGSSFTIDVDRRKQRNKLLLSITYNLADETLLSMVDEGRILVATKITSSTVATMRAYSFPKGVRSISTRLDSMEFEKDVSIVCYLVANEDFYLENEHLGPIWTGVKSFVQKGNLIGESNEEVIRTDRHKDGETTSIFSFVVGKGLKPGSTFAMELENDRITFSLSKEDYDTYNRIQHRAPETIVSGVLFPCLVQIFDEMKEDYSGDDGVDTTNEFNRKFSNRAWHQVLRDQFLRLYPDDDPRHTGKKPFQIAQELLKSPLSKMFTFSEQAVKKGQVQVDE